jgi:hypothetical protein
MKRIKVLTYALTALLLLAGCRNPIDINRPDDYNHLLTRPFSGGFESFWNGMNMYYVFWDVEPADYWDYVWYKYKPKFDALEARLASGENKEVLLLEGHQYFLEFLTPLNDGHLEVFFNFDLENISPVDNRVAARFSGLTANNNPRRAFLSTWSGTPFTVRPSYTNYNYWEHTIQNYVVDNAIGFPKPPYAPAGVPPDIFRITTGRIPHTGGGFILYFYFSAFAILENLTDDEVEEVLEQYIEDIADDDLRGVIIDIRGNGGGNTIEIPLLLNRLINQPLHFAYTRYKSGLNRLAYSPWIPFIIHPHPVQYERAKNNVPVVAIVNDHSVSCAELLPMAVRAMGNGHTVGTRTHGGTGPRFGDISPAALNSGSFINRSGSTIWSQTVIAGFQVRSANRTSYEGVGLTPDQVVEFNWSEFSTGRDRQLEAAISHIDDGRSWLP